MSGKKKNKYHDIRELLSQQSSKENDENSATPKASAFGVLSQKERIENGPQTPLKDVGNTLGKGTDGGKVKPESGNVEQEEDKETGFKFSGVGIEGEHIVRGKANDTIYAVLMSMDIVQQLKKKNLKKEVHLLDKLGGTGFMNLGMPLKCLEEDSHFEMLFCPFGQGDISDHTDEDGVIKERYRKYDGVVNEFVKFYVSAKGMNSKKILLSKTLHQSRYPLCVFAAREESFHTALCKDERFLPTLEKTAWKMVEKNKAIYSPDILVNNYAKRTFSVEFSKQRRKKVSHATSGQTSKHSQSSTEEKLQCFGQSLLDQYPCLSQQGILIEEALKEEAKCQRKRPQTLLEEVKEDFGKKTINSTTVRVHKKLIRRSRSVGFIRWNNNGNEGNASCFLLAGCYILTCHHVIRAIVGEGVEEKDWPEAISQSAEVTFTYEKNKVPKKARWYSIERWLECSEKSMDYALLKLAKNKRRFPTGLMRCIDKQPFNGLVYIIGHPEGKAKTIDGCTVVPFIQRFVEMKHRLHEEQKKDCNAANCSYEEGGGCVHLFSPSSFWSILTPRTLTYDTSFFHGSSGSPVLNASGHVVAVHSAGYSYKCQGEKRSMIEFGWSLKEICSDIESKNKTLYSSLLKEDGMGDTGDGDTNERDMSNDETIESDQGNEETREDNMCDEETIEDINNNEDREDMEVDGQLDRFRKRIHF